MPQTIESQSPPSLTSGVYIFGGVSLLWLLIGEVLCWGMSRGTVENAFFALSSFLALWMFSILDLAVLAKFLYSVGQILGANERTRAAYTVQTLIWGVTKLVCLGLFVLILLKGHEIPMHSLLLGMGTLVLVPLAGGYIWSQRVLKNA